MTDLDWLRGTNKIVLPNGLTLLLHRQQTSEAAGLHFCVKAGYFCETDEEVGLAHLLEHMYFKGSGRFPEPGTLGILMKALGGSINATTSYDQTNYFCEVPAENLFPALEIMSDAFLDPLFPTDELVKETEVVIEEFNRKVDSPAAYSQEKLIQLAFQKHRMRRWRIGTPEQLRSYTRENLFDYFHRYYQPKNMIVTVTGQFDEDATAELLTRFLSPLKAHHESKKDFGPAEPEQNEIRYAFHKATATQSYLHFAFHVPGVLHPDGPALDFLNFLLSSGRSGRLQRRVMEQQRSASSVSGGYIAYEDIGLIIITAVMEAEKIRDAGRDVWWVLSDLLQNGISTDELQKIKNKLRLHQSMQTEDVLNLAQLLSYYESYGDYHLIEKYVESMMSLTQERILEVAGKYLNVSNLSVLEFVNKDLPQLGSEEYARHLSEVPAVPEVSLSPPMILQFQNGIGKAKTFDRPIIQKGKATYILHPDARFPFVAAGFFFTGGRNEEDQQNAGITHLLFRTALKGTSRYTAEQIAFRFDGLGNPPRFNCYRDYSGFSFEALPESFPEMWNLLIHCIVDAKFPEKEIETEKQKLVSVIRRNLDDNFVRPLQLVQRAFYGQHPYSIPETGYEESIRQVGQQQLLRWKERLWTADRITIGAVGSFDPDKLISHFEESISQIESAGQRFQPPSSVKIPSSKEEAESRPKKQTAFALAFPADDALKPDIYKYEALQQILSGMGGRLFLNLRSKRSLAYTVFAATVAGLYSGTFLTYLAGEAGKEKEAIYGMWQELNQMKEAPVSAEELANAKSALIGNYILNTQTASMRVSDYIGCYIAQRPVPYAPLYRELVHSLTIDEIRELSRKTFNIDNSTIGIVRGTADSATLL